MSIVVAAGEVDAALRELCEGTCDVDADCDADMDGKMICDLSAVPAGRPRASCQDNRDVMLLAITLAAMVGAFVVFRREIVDYLSNRHKRKGPPMDFVVLVETDIEGSSELWETMGAAGYGDIMKDQVMGVHDEVLRRSMKKHYGYELFVRGDAFVVAFHSVDDALAWCLQVQLDLMQRMARGDARHHRRHAARLGHVRGPARAHGRALWARGERGEAPGQGGVRGRGDAPGDWGG